MNDDELFTIKQENEKLKNENRNLRAEIFLHENCTYDIIEHQKIIDDLQYKIYELNNKIQKIRDLLYPQNLNKRLYYIDVINDIKKILNI